MKDLLDKLTGSLTYEEYEDGYRLYTPIMYEYADHTFSFYLKRNPTGSYIISDLGQTWDYMRECFDPNKYIDKIHSVCEIYSLTLENREFSAILSISQTERNFYNFISALNLLANIDLI